MNIYYDTFPIPFGDFSVAADEGGNLVATAFGSLDSLLSRLKECRAIRDARRIRTARKQVREYFAGERTRFDLPLSPAGTAFQISVWTALRSIPLGTTTSYGRLASGLGRPRAARAIGRANASNPICLIVPCHRVIGADGSLTGFAFGEEIKRRLLAHERPTDGTSD